MAACVRRHVWWRVATASVPASTTTRCSSSPVVRATTVRAVLSIAAVLDMELDQMDAVTAFLNAPLEETLFMRVPDGFEAPPGSVLRLRKSLYGLKQSPREWNGTLHQWLLSRRLH